MADKNADDLTPLRLTFRPLPSDIPASVRFRHLLKRALRDYKLRCTSVEPVPRQDPAPEKTP